MQDSAFEAIYTGVYIFVFIAALTTTLYMFRNVNEVAERSYEYGKQVQGQAIIEAPTEDKVYLTESEVISYYFNYVRKDIYGDNKEGNDIKIEIQGLRDGRS